jgi:hypothetical protein
LNNLSTKDLLTLGNLLSTEFMNPRWQFFATLVGELGFHKNWETKS